MADLWTEDPRLAALYDIECAARHDHDFYLRVAADLKASAVLDLGCGTGVFAVDLARAGHQAIGIDPAAPMLDIARLRPDGDRVTWIEGRAADGPSASADLVVMMGHVAQYFVCDDDWASTLAEIRRVLKPGGHLTFETRNPQIDWANEWTREKTTSWFPHPDGGKFTSWVQVIEIVGSPDSYTMTHEGHSVLPDGLHLQAAETLRFRSTSEIEESLRHAGFVIEETWGDLDRSPLTSSSRELLVLAS